MTKVFAAITTSIDGYITGPDDGPDKGLGAGGERLHYWVFGGPWTYAGGPEGSGEATGEDAAWLQAAMESMGAVVGGRWTYEASGHWGGSNPWGVPFFIVTHHPEDEPAGAGFRFVDGLAPAIEAAQAAAGDKDVHLMGGADLIRQGFAEGLIDDFTLIIAPLVLGGGKRLFEGFEQDLEFEHLGVRQSQFATFIDYRVKK